PGRVSGELSPSDTLSTIGRGRWSVNWAGAGGLEPFLAELADLGEVSPATRQDRDGIQNVAHSVLAYPVTTQHAGQRVTSFPPDGDTAHPATAEEYPRCGCGAGGVATVTAHGVRLSSPLRVGLESNGVTGPAFTGRCVSRPAPTAPRPAGVILPSARR